VEDVFKMLATKIVKKIESKEINPDSESNYGFRRNKKAGSPTKPSTIKIEKPQVINREVQKDKCSC